MKREVASLTKMMTFYVVLKLLVRFQMQPKQVQVQITKNAAACTGTSANLKEGDILTVEQLCYGMMLPSGNDAAYSLAEFFGNLIHERKQTQVVPMCPNSQFTNTPVRFFIKEMNLQA